LNARIFANNQSLEEGNNQQKNLTSTVKEDMADLSSLIYRRWDDCFESGCLLIKQLHDAGRVIQRRKGRGKGKKEEGVKKKRSHVKESNMKWRKCHRTVKSTLYLWRKRMDMALVATRGLGIVEYKDSSISSKWKAMNNYGVSKDGLFMQRSNFTIWYNDKRKIPLQRQSMDVLRKFWEEYNTSKNTDDKESVTQMAGLFNPEWNLI